MSRTADDKPQVEYRQLGKSGLRVSVPILGAISFGDPKWEVSENLIPNLVWPFVQ